MPRKKKQPKKIKPEAKIEVAPKPKPTKETPQLVRGMKDILPAEQPYFEFVKGALEKFAKDYNYEKIDPPILEDTFLFVRGTGKYTDIVEK